MNEELMEILKAIKIGVLCILSFPALCAPPKQFIRSASIDLEQGEKIYGNGKMQSVVRVKYKLYDGAELVEIELREFGTNELLSRVGWDETATDSGFDHNISLSRNKYHHLVKNVTSRLLYISTKRQNQAITICFNIKAKNGTEHSTYSSCDDEELINGTVNIMAIRTPKYTGVDFYVAHLTTFLDIYYTSDPVTNDINGVLYTIRKKDHLPNGLTFKKVTSVSSPNVLIDSQLGFLSNYIMDWNTNSPSYSSTHLLQDNKKVTMKIPRRVQPIPDVGSDYDVVMLNGSDYKDELVLIAHITYFKGTFLLSLTKAVDSYRCEYTPNDSGFVQCFGPEKFQYELSKFNKDAVWKTSNDILLIDNYGNEHTITISIDRDIPRSNRIKLT